MTSQKFDPAAKGWTVRESEGFIGLVGPFWSRETEGDWRWGFLAESRHLNFQGMVHGGMLMAFIDQTIGIAVHRQLEKQRAVTADLSVHFLDAAREGDFIEAETFVIRKTRSLMFMRGELMVGSRVLLSAQGIWKILGA